MPSSLSSASDCGEVRDPPAPADIATNTISASVGSIATELAA